MIDTKTEPKTRTEALLELTILSGHIDYLLRDDPSPEALTDRMVHAGAEIPSECWEDFVFSWISSKLGSAADVFSVSYDGTIESHRFKAAFDLPEIFKYVRWSG